MEQYKDLGNNSGVSAYEIGADSITVKFNDGFCYVYTNISAGSFNIEQMKKLAFNGQGLNTFINKNVKDKFIRKYKS